MIKLPNSKLYLVEFSSISILDYMTNTYNQLKKELSVLYPDVTEKELNEMTNNLIDFYITAVKVVLKDENQEETSNPLTDIDDTN